MMRPRQYLNSQHARKKANGFSGARGKGRRPTAGPSKTSNKSNRIMTSKSLPLTSVATALLLAGLLACPSPAAAQITMFWDPNLTDSPYSGGGGTWSTAANWFNGTLDTTWVSGNIANFGGSAGTVTLGAAETASGLTFTASGYILSGSPTLTLIGTPTFNVPSGGTATINTVIGDGGAGIPLTVSGGGTLVLGGVNTYGGVTTVGSASTLQINVSAGAGTGTITDSGIVIVNLTSGGAVANAVSGGSSSVIDVNIISGKNAYLSGSLAGFYGTLNITNVTSTGADFCGMTNAGPLSIPATAGGIYIATNTELYINSATPLTCPVTINGPGYSAGYGAIRLDSGTVSGNILLNGNTTNNQLGGAGVTAVTYSGVISDGGNNYGLSIWGGGSTPNTKVFALSGQNTYGGQTTLSFGTLRVASAENQGISGPLGKSNALSTIYFNGQATTTGNGVGGGRLQYTSANQFDYSGRFSTLPGQSYRIDVNGQSVAFASPLASSGGTFLLFDTAGGGKLIMSASNTYGGLTSISNGTLDISVTGSIAGDVTNAGGTLELDNSFALSLGATLGVNAGATVNLTYAGTAYIGNLYVAGIQHPSGVYGASANNPNGVFSGPGTLTIGLLPPITMSSPTIQSNQLVISWSSVPGSSYNVYSTTDLTLPFPSSWTFVAGSIPATGAKTTFTVPGAISNYPQLFLGVQQ
jgi:autotransporter-associated beta strand protein